MIIPEEKPVEVGPDVEKLMAFVSKAKGIDLASYRKNFVARRVNVRIHATHMNDCAAYLDYMKNHPDEINFFLDALSINVTEFFRDPEVFDVLRTTIIPSLLKAKEETGRHILRIWSVPCASGEEPYSVAILMHEALALKKDFVLKIVGTDVDNDALAKARAASYKAAVVLKMQNKEILDKYFVPDYNRENYQLKEDIQAMVKFHQHDVINERPLNTMDIILCRNLMIYLNRQQQDALLQKFAEAMNPGGYLVLGKVETIWSRDVFETLDAYNKIYRKRSGVL